MACVQKKMAAERARRANAGSNISRIIEEDANQDEFYQTAYGGFEEVAVDEEYEVKCPRRGSSCQF